MTKDYILAKGYDIKRTMEESCHLSTTGCSPISSLNIEEVFDCARFNLEEINIGTDIL
ncbi:MAG: hypothetical protein V3V43_02435 [Dehalococcoidales bacterium]